jgi:hypothetical protein
MASLLSCSIDYYADSVLCFDPQKVLSKLADAFPEAVIDPTDLAAAEVVSIQEYTDAKTDMPAERKETMRRQIMGKQKRIGPSYGFRISDSVTGHANRYSLLFKTDGRFDSALSDRIRRFMASLGAGDISDTQLD